MSAPRSLNIRKLDRNLHERPTRSGRDHKPNADDEGEEGHLERGVLSVPSQDRLFQDALLLALARRKEKMPTEDKTTGAAVPRRINAVTYMPTASVADTLG